MSRLVGRGSDGFLVRGQPQDAFRSTAWRLRDVVDEVLHGLSAVFVALLDRWARDSSIKIEQGGGKGRSWTNRECLEISLGSLTDLDDDLLRAPAHLCGVALANLIHTLKHPQVSLHVA